MSLTKATLRTRILDMAKRPALSSEADHAIRECEGYIARELRAAEMLKRTTLTDSDRNDGSIFDLPTGFLEERAVFYSDSDGDRQLEKVGFAELRRVKNTTPVRHYAILSGSLIEFRGNPGSAAEMEMIYFERPAALNADSDTNDLLTNHEAIYVHGALANLYLWSQDLELMQVSATITQDAIDTLNEQCGRMLGGARTAQAYNLSSYGGR